MKCAVEAKVGFPSAMAVLFRGKPVKSPATQRVADWAKTNGFRLTPERKPVKDALAEIDAMLPKGDA